MLAGVIPFTAESPVAVLLKQVNEPLPAPANGQIRAAAMQAIRKASAKDPADRWASAEAFVTALETALIGEKSIAHVGLRARGFDRSNVRHTLGWTATGGGVLVALASAAWLVVRDPSVAAPRPSTIVSPPAADIPLATRADNRQVPVQAGAPVAAATPQPVPARQSSRPPEVTSTAQDLERPVAAVSAGALPAALAPLEATEPAPAIRPVSVPDRTSTPVVEPQARIPVSGAEVAQPRPSGVVIPPARVRSVPPAYPDVARAAQIEGDVLIEALVDPDGRVRNVNVVRAVHPLLDAAAKAAVLQYQYRPGLRNGVPEAATVRITVSFRIR
jgi:TonB family protein